MSKPDENDNAKQGPFFKRQPNPQLWKEVQALAQGSEEEQLQAVETIFSRLNELPSKANALLLDLAEGGSLSVKRRLAFLLATQSWLSMGSLMDLLKALSTEEDEEVKELVRKAVDALLEPFRKTVDSIRVSHEHLLAGISKKLFSDLLRPQTATWPQFRLPLEELQKSVELFRLQVAQVQIPRDFLDSVNRLSVYNDSLFRGFARLQPSYFPVEPRVTPAQPVEHSLITRLRKLAPGRQTWSEYQSLCQETLSFCLVPPLLEPSVESSASCGIHRRDMMYPIPHEAGGFWDHIRLAYDALAIIVDAKNHSGPLPKDQIVITSKYFGKKKLGTFGVIVCRQGLNDSGRKEQDDRWVHHDEMIVCLNDADLEEMVSLKLAGKEPEVVIDRHIRELRSRL